MPPLVVTLILTVVVIGTALAGLAVGVIVSNRRIQGSCGGLANFKDRDGNSICDACTEPSPECRQLLDEVEAARERTAVGAAGETAGSDASA